MFELEFKDNFVQLGECLLRWLDSEACEPLMDNAIALSYRDNPFFTPYMQRYAMRTIAQTFLCREELERWLGNYSVTKNKKYTDWIGIIMAGNIPLVGFHDFLCVMACGSGAVIKLSSKDKFLLPAVFGLLCRINPIWRNRVQFVTEMKETINRYTNNFKGLISTGSDATKQAVSQEYAGIPMLLRGQRFSFAIISGYETKQELQALATDVFLYYGLGCRNVSYLLVPREYDFTELLKNFAQMRTLVADECYMNIYKRNKAILVLEDEKFLDGGFFLIRQTANVHSFIGELGYMEYGSESDVLAFENENWGKIQKKYRTFGLAQAPEIDEYADGTDVMDFILYL